MGILPGVARGHLAAVLTSAPGPAEAEPGAACAAESGCRIGLMRNSPTGTAATRVTTSSPDVIVKSVWIPARRAFELVATSRPAYLCRQSAGNKAHPIAVLGSMNKGDVVPDFEAFTHDGVKFRLSSVLADGPVVLFFYPRAMTRGCTAESCHFRDLAAEFRAFNATRVGISSDSVERQATFADKEGLDYSLLSDPDREIARLFGVKRPGPLFNRRTTFVIGTDRVVVAVIASETNMNTHADTALTVLGAPS